MAAIYYIQNINNGKQYVGQTIHSYHKRCKRHFTYLSSNTHTNSHLQNAFNKEPGAFISGSLLENVCPVSVTDLEIQYIKLLRTADPVYGYNLTHGGEGCSPNEATRIKMSAANKGSAHPMYGKAQSAETKAKISAARMGTTPSAETKAKISAAKKGSAHPMYGKAHSAETKAKMSAAMMGRTPSAETKAKLSAAKKGSAHPMYGKAHSAETKAKMSAANKGNRTLVYQL